jgi:hypothetical protein
MNAEIGCALAGAAALGAVIVISTNVGGKRMFAPRGGQCASAMRTTTSNNPQTDKGAATCSGGGGLIDGFNAPTHFDPPSLQTPVNAQAGMTAQRRTLTEMVTAQLDSSLNTKLTGHSVLMAGRCADDAAKPDCTNIKSHMWFNSPLDAHTSTC